LPNAKAYQSLARRAESGLLDAIFLGIPVDGSLDHVNAMRLDPLPLLGSLIGVTNRVGLAASWTVDFTEPFHVARVFATLDHLSYGRTAWIADMFNTEPLLPLIGKSRETYDLTHYCARAGEFIDVVKELWDSWEDEAFALDKASGTFVDPDRVHPINHVDEYFHVRGPLNLPRPPQGNPVLMLRDPPTVTARQFVAKVADVILIDGPSASGYEELRSLAAGRDVRILANLLCVLDETETAARDRARMLDGMVTPGTGHARFVGTPTQLVDFFALCQEQRACDGFNLLPAVLPDDVDWIIDAIIPLARSRGMVRSEYSGTTLREHLGLARPRSQYAGAQFA
jgi:alkanesulfonate monooxygenase SsuD/methylene tetrahydromethanopterin reductase-like flavin-dependent oxidoreductase (luciferase family)